MSSKHGIEDGIAVTVHPILPPLDSYSVLSRVSIPLPMGLCTKESRLSLGNQEQSYPPTTVGGPRESTQLN